MSKLINFVLECIAKYWRQLSSVFFVVITALSLLPLPELPEIPGTDKTHHLLAYAALAFPVCLAGRRAAMFLLPLFALWSGGIELVQPFVNRYGEWLDLAANALGLLIGAVLGVLIRRFWKFFLAQT